jgi:hypothetical protein
MGIRARNERFWMSSAGRWVKFTDSGEFAAALQIDGGKKRQKAGEWPAA